VHESAHGGLRFFPNPALKSDSCRKIAITLINQILSVEAGAEAKTWLEVV